MKTTTTPVSAPAWHIIDATDQSVGRMAAAIAHVLRGKHKVDFSAHQLCGDHVVVINIEKIQTTPKKLIQTQYVSHSGYLGHIKSTSMKDMLERHPDRILSKAVQGMLPKNKLRAEMLKRVHIFVGNEHAHTAQQPTPLTF